jgi:lactoylglutathione lyase
MEFRFLHNNINVFDLDRSIRFYEKALGLKEVHRIEGEGGNFIIVYLGDGVSVHQLELTWLRDRETAYHLGDNEFHLAFETDDFDRALKMHQEMGVVVYENPDMGIYFIADPDGYWVEILPDNYTG